MLGLLGLVLLLASGWAWGARVWPRGQPAGWDGFLLRLALGLGVLSHFVWLLGMVHALYPWALVVGLLAPWGRLFLRAQQAAQRRAQAQRAAQLGDPAQHPSLRPAGYWGQGAAQLRAGEWALLAALAFTVVCNTLEAMTWDDCPDRYHVIHMRNAYLWRGFADPPNVLTVYYPQFIDHLFVPMFLFTREDAGSLVHNAFAVLLGVAVFAAGRRLAGRLAGFLSAGLLATTVQIHQFAPFGYNDLGSAFYLTVALYALYLSLTESSPEAARRMCLASGLLAGWCAQSRLNAGFYVLVLGLAVWGLASATRRQPGWGRHASVWLGCFALGTLPWMIRNLVGAGSPLLPLEAPFFSTPPELRQALVGYANEFGWTLPSPVVWWAGCGLVVRGAALDGHAPLFVLLVFSPLFLYYGWKRRRWEALGLFLLCLVSIAAAGFLGIGRMRYFLPTTGLHAVALGVFCARMLADIPRNRPRMEQAALAGLAVLVAGLYLGVRDYRGHLTRFPPLTPSGRLQFQSQHDRSYPYWSTINRLARPGDRLLVAGTTLRYQYLDIPYNPPPYYGRPLEELVMERERSVPAITAELRRQGYTLLLAAPDARILLLVEARELARWPGAVLVRVGVRGNGT